MSSTSKNEQISQNDIIHVVHVVTSLEPGGLENGVVNLALSLDSRRFRTSIVCLERHGEFCERLPPEVEVVCLEKPPGFKISASVQLGKVLTNMGADVIHTHNLGPLIYGSIALTFFMSQGVIAHGEHAELRPDEKTFRRRWTRKLGYKACGVVHTVSAGLRDNLIDFGLPEAKIRVIRNGVDCDRFSPGDEESEGTGDFQESLEPNHLVMGIVGRFGALKRHDLLLSAFELLSETQRDLRLLIVGDNGPNKERILKLVEDSPVHDRIIWAGFLQDPVSAYRSMDLLVIPSENEGLSNAMLEAMSCEVPCLAHPACGATEVIIDGKNGFLRPMSDGRGLADELAGILDERRNVQEMGKAARKTAMESFSLSSMMKGYEEMYEDAVSKTDKKE